MPKLISKALKLISSGQNKVSKTRELTAKIRTKVSIVGLLVWFATLFYFSAISSLVVRGAELSFLRILAYENSSCLLGLPL